MLALCVVLRAGGCTSSTAAEGGLLSARALLVLPQQPQTFLGTPASCRSYPHLEEGKQGQIRLHGGEREREAVP